MHFAFTEEQDMMAEAVRGLLAERCTAADLRALIGKGETFDARRWEALIGMGLLGALLPEEAGGLGLSGADMVQIATACGASLLPEPLIDMAMISLPLLAELSASDPLEKALAGTTTIALSHPLAPLVADADRAAAILHFDGERVCLLTPDTARLTSQPGIDPLRRLFTVRPSADATGLAEGPSAIAVAARTADRGALASAAQLLGVAEKAIDMAVAYAGERQQFGKPIGANQAVKHLLSTAQVRVEFARPVLHAAACLVPGAGPQTAARISHAKIVCAEAADLATRTAIQVHGAMGYSLEVDVHLYLKRALALGHAWGTQAHHRAVVDARLSALPYSVETLFPQEA